MNGRDTGLVRLNSWKALGAAFGLSRVLGDSRGAFQEFYAYHAREVDSVFKALGRGGTYRGVTWAGWSPYSAGRPRPSGRRVNSSSQLLQDTGRLRQDATTGFVLMTKERLQYGPSVFYAREMYAKRSPYSVTRTDIQQLGAIFRKATTDALRRGGQR